MPSWSTRPPRNRSGYAATPHVPSLDQFLAVFRVYNRAVWPAQIALYLLGFGLVVTPWQVRERGGRWAVAGADLEHWCTDVMERPPRIDSVWLAVSGEALVTLVERAGPDPPGDDRRRPRPAAAVVDLRRIVLAREDAPEESTTLSGLRLAGTLGVPGGG